MEKVDRTKSLIFGIKSSEISSLKQCKGPTSQMVLVASALLCLFKIEPAATAAGAWAQFQKLISDHDAFLLQLLDYDVTKTDGKMLIAISQYTSVQDFGPQK